jgi:multicomponent Na+:H+ antiporter subunit E
MQKNVHQVALNVFLAMMWMLLQPTFTITKFVSGYILGMVLIYLIACKIAGHKFYMKRVFLALKLLGVFFVELLKACWEVMCHVLSPKLIIRPGIVKMDIYLQTDAQITLLANMITLTPGTLTVGVAPDNSALFIHALYIDDADELCAGIERTFERTILEVWEG